MGELFTYIDYRIPLPFYDLFFTCGKTESQVSHKMFLILLSNISWFRMCSISVELPSIFFFFFNCRLYYYQNRFYSRYLYAYYCSFSLLDVIIFILLFIIFFLFRFLICFFGSGFGVLGFSLKLFLFPLKFG